AFGNVAGERAPCLGEDLLQAVEEPVDFALAAQEDAAKDERQAAIRMMLAVCDGERRSPGAAEHDPFVDAQVLAQPLQVVDELGRRVVLDATQRLRAAGAALVVDDDAVRVRIEKLAMHGAGPRARTAVKEHDRDSLRISRLLVVHAMRALEVEMSAREWLDGREEGEQLARGVFFLRHRGNYNDVRCVKDFGEINSVHYAASQQQKG